VIPFGPPQWILLAVALQRLAELALARRNTARLMAEGAEEHGAGHYPLFVVLQSAWLAGLFLLVPEEEPIRWGWLALFLGLQAARIWVIASLGRFWTTRVIVPAEPALVRRGPYRLLRHPNYVVVMGEIAVLPLVFGQWEAAAVFAVLQLALIRHRIRVEDRALAGFR
jgi:methyltransferase